MMHGQQKVKFTNEPLNLFFVDLGSAENKKEINDIKSLQNKIIQIEPPRVKRIS